MMPPFLLLFVFFGVCEATGQISYEDSLEVVEALAEADLVPDLPSSWSGETGNDQKDKTWKMQLDTRLALDHGKDLDSLNKFKFESSYFSTRGRWRRDATRSNLLAMTANLNWGSMAVQVGSMGISAGYGLLISYPGRSSAVSAGQSFSNQSTGVRGWATTPVKRSALGLGMTWRPGNWVIMGMHGRLGPSSDGNTLSVFGVERHFGSLQTGWALARMGNQQGISSSGMWSQGGHSLGFELVLWKSVGKEPKHGAWMVLWKLAAIRRWDLELQFAASSGSEGPLTGMRPAVLDVWNGAGWAVRLSSPRVNSWRLKFLLADNLGRDWSGSHQSQSKQFFDFKLNGNLSEGWKISARWHQRIRIWKAWSEAYPWLPSQKVKEDRRLGLTVDLKGGGKDQPWIFSLRSLSREGAATNGRRSLVSVRRRLKWGKFSTVLLSFQTAWGAPVDLVTAINPMAGLLLPRHWGHWASEILAGLEREFGWIRFMTAVSRREPSKGENLETEFCFWAGARALW